MNSDYFDQSDLEKVVQHLESSPLPICREAAERIRELMTPVQLQVGVVPSRFLDSVVLQDLPYSSSDPFSDVIDDACNMVASKSLPRFRFVLLAVPSEGAEGINP